jgi:nucleoside-diphosphate-sugar epimerase
VRIVVTGASGNVGTSLVRALAADGGVGDAHGPFNVAAEPVLDPCTLGEALETARR